MIDTLQLSKTLQKDFTPAQAEALASLLSRQVVEDLATRRDVDDVRREIEESKKDLRSEIKDAVVELRNEIRDVKIDMIRWIAGAIGLNFIATAGLMITLIKAIH